MPKKDKLTKKERDAAEEHLLSFGESIRQSERRSNTHKYRPRSSYFPSRLVSLLLDKFLVIHFPSELERILDGSWSYYSSHGNALFDTIIQVQTSITVQRNTQGPSQGKQYERRQVAAQAIDDKDPDVQTISDVKLSEQPVEEATEQFLNLASEPSTSCKRPALENVTTGNTTKRRRAPRAPQLSLSEVQDSYGPQYRTRRSALVAEASTEGDTGKENRRSSRRM
jgi:hypothetical protein